MKNDSSSNEKINALSYLEIIFDFLRPSIEDSFDYGDVILAGR